MLVSRKNLHDNRVRKVRKRYNQNAFFTAAQLPGIGFNDHAADYDFTHFPGYLVNRYCFFLEIPAIYDIRVI